MPTRCGQKPGHMSQREVGPELFLTPGTLECNYELICGAEHQLILRTIQRSIPGWRGTARYPLFSTADSYADSSIPAMIINPSQTIPYREISEITRYLREGGKLLLLVDLNAVELEHISSLLAEFDMGVEIVRSSTDYYDANGPDLQSNPLSLPLDLLTETHNASGELRARGANVSYALVGVTPLIVDDAGVVVAGEKTVGQGKITVFTRSLLFSEYIFGDVWGGKDVSEEKLKPLSICL